MHVNAKKRRRKCLIQNKLCFFFCNDEPSLRRKRASADVCICACSAGTEEEEEEEGRTEGQLGDRGSQHLRIRNTLHRIKLIKMPVPPSREPPMPQKVAGFVWSVPEGQRWTSEPWFHLLG